MRQMLDNTYTHVLCRSLNNSISNYENSSFPVHRQFTIVLQIDLQKLKFSRKQLNRKYPF
jgi:hypothetical protein